MIPKNPAPDMIRGGSRFSENIMPNKRPGDVTRKRAAGQRRALSRPQRGARVECIIIYFVTTGVIRWSMLKCGERNRAANVGEPLARISEA